MLRFNDGMNFDLSGELRAVCRRDGWYVVGKGMLVPADSYADALDMIREMTPKPKAPPSK